MLKAKGVGSDFKKMDPPLPSNPAKQEQSICSTVKSKNYK
jgi:hypothetical protein